MNNYSVLLAMASITIGDQYYPISKVDQTRYADIESEHPEYKIQDILAEMKRQDLEVGINPYDSAVTADMVTKSAIASRKRNSLPAPMAQEISHGPKQETVNTPNVTVIHSVEEPVSVEQVLQNAPVVINIPECDITVVDGIDTSKYTPEYLLNNRYVTDADSAQSLAEEIKKHPDIVRDIEDIRTKAEQKAAEIAGAIPDEPEKPSDATSAVAASGTAPTAAFQHNIRIPDDSIVQDGIIDFTLFGGNKIDTRNVDEQPAVQQQPLYQQPAQQQSPVYQPSEDVFIPTIPGCENMRIPMDNYGNVNPVLIVSQGTQGLQVNPALVAQQGFNMVSDQKPYGNNLVNRIITKKKKNPADTIEITGAPVIKGSENPKVTPDIVHPIPPAPITNAEEQEKTKAVHNPLNEQLIRKYWFLKNVEETANKLGYSVFFNEKENPKWDDPSKPCGLISVYVSKNGITDFHKCFTIDSGNLYDFRIKFFPGLLNSAALFDSGKCYEDFSVYSITLGGKNNEYTDRNLKTFLLGGPLAMQTDSGMYKPDKVELNKLVELRSMPKNLAMNVEARKAVIFRLIKVMKTGLFYKFLEIAPLSRWKFKSFNPKDGSFVLTNEGCPYRFNMPCYAEKEMLIYVTAKNVRYELGKDLKPRPING